MPQFHFISTQSQCRRNRSHHFVKLLRYSSFLSSFPSYGNSDHFLAMDSTNFSSHPSHVSLLCAPFFNWGLKIIVFYRVGMLTLFPTPNLEDQDFILDMLSLGNSESAFSCWDLSGLGDPAATYTTKCTAPSLLQACNHPHPASWDIRFLIVWSFVQLVTEHIRAKWSYFMYIWYSSNEICFAVSLCPLI